MKHRLFLIIATLVGLGSTFTSCSWDDELVVAPNDGDFKTPISFNVNIGSLPDPEVTSSTRGTTQQNADGTASGYYFNGGELLSIGVEKKSGSSSRTGDEIKQYTVASGNASKTSPAGSVGSARSLSYSGATSTDAFNWLSADEVITLRAWSDATNGGTTTTDPDGQSFSIETTQTGDYVKELLYSPKTDYGYTTYQNELTIPLYHQLSRVVVNITGTIPSDVSVTGVQIGSEDNVPTSATFSMPGDHSSVQGDAKHYLYGNWSSQNTPGVITAKKETTNTAITGNQATYSAVIIPYDGVTNNDYYKSGYKFIVINTSRGTYAYSLSNNMNFEPGKQYTFNITDLNQIDLNVTVSAWTDDTKNSETVTFAN